MVLRTIVMGCYINQLITGGAHIVVIMRFIFISLWLVVEPVVEPYPPEK